MKTKMYLNSLLVLILWGCGPENTDYTPSPGDVAIVGGDTTDKDNPIANYVVLIYDNPTKTYCTGTLIKKNLILTAAHCIGAGPEGLSLAFGLNPLSGQYTLIKAHKVAFHSKYKKLNASERNDVALISFKQAAPANYRPVLLPMADFPLQKGLRFTAAGYGRISGKRTTPNDTQGSGQLRQVELGIVSFSQDETQFYVDQASGKGICSGDSGGPALMRYADKDYVVGVASAISWTIPDEVREEERSQYIQNKDVCREKSIYMNVKKYLPWIEENSKKLLN